MPSFIVYFRVSTQKQGQSGLGREGQELIVQQHIQAYGGEIKAEYEEIESGGWQSLDDRPQLAKAIAHARRARATLLVAKLDRLARDAVFLLTLQRSGLPLVFCDIPGANEFTVGVMALVAEQERRRISDHTKHALRAYKARGGVLGSHRPGAKPLNPAAWAKGQKRGAATTKRRASEAYADILPLMQGLRGSGESLAAIAKHLTGVGYATRTDKPWSATQVKRVLDRAAV